MLLTKDQERRLAQLLLNRINNSPAISYEKFDSTPGLTAVYSPLLTLRVEADLAPSL